jgi:hypothetical protein
MRSHTEFMAVEREALAAMLVVCTNTVREVARVAEEAAVTSTAWVEEVTMETAMRKEMAKERARWDADMAAARRNREIPS